MALTQSQVSQLYVAIFNRASEGSGNTYWQTTGLDAAATANEMLATSDATTYFGSSLDSNQAFVEHVYLNTLNKTVTDDAAGIAYWVGLLDAGTSRGAVVAGLVDAVSQYADSTDPVTKAAYDQFTNRVEVSDYMATTVSAAPSDYATSTSFTTASNPNGALNVTSVDSTVDTAKTAVNVLPTGTVGEIKILTTGMDTFSGTASDDTIYGVIDAATPTNNTFSSFDSVNGNNGYDTFNVSMDDDYAGTSSISNIEKLAIKTTAAKFFDASGISGIDTITNDRSTNALTVKGVGSTATTLEMNKISNILADLTVTFADTAVSGTADTATLNITGGMGTAANGVGDNEVTIQSAASTNAVENVTVNVTGGAAYIGDLDVIDNATAAASTLAKLTVTGSSDLTIVDALDFVGTAGTLDASAATGKVKATFGAENVTVTGGTGDDTFVFAGNLDVNDTINGGAGTDAISTTDAIMDDLTSTTLIKNSAATVTNIETVIISDEVATGATYSATDVASTVNKIVVEDDLVDGTFTYAAGANTLTIGDTAGANDGAGGTDKVGGAVAIVVSGAATTDTFTVEIASSVVDMNSQAITTTGVEELTISNSKEDTEYDIGAITMTASSGGTTTVKFTGSKGANADAITAKTIDASGLSGTVGLVMDSAAVTVTTITGSANNDTLLGDDASTINAGAGNDTVTGGTGNDTLNGEAGNDTITTNTGNDTVDAGAGDDTVTMNANLDYNDISIAGGEGTDTLSITAAHAETISAYSTANKALIDARVTGFEKLLVNDGLSGQTTIAMDDLFNLSKIDLGVASGADSIQTNSTILKVVDATTITYLEDSTAAADTLTLTMANATGSADSLSVVLKDNDTISAEFGELAAAGVETININSTKTAANATTTRNNLDLTDAAAAGLTTLNISGNVALTSIVSSTTLTTIDASASTITGTNGMIITAAGTTVAVTATGSSANDAIYTGSAADTINGMGGDDTLSGLSGNDTINGGVGADTIDGGAGNDTIDGGEGNDTISTSSGADSINGGEGTDILSISSSAYANISALTTSNIETLNMNSLATTMTVAQLGAFTTITNAAAATLTDAGTVNLGTSITSVTLANGTNTVTASTTAASYTLVGGTGADTFNFGSDLITISDSIDGTLGSDTLNITGNTAVGATALNAISNIDTVNFSNTTTTVAWTSDDGDATAAMTVDASSLTSAAATLNFSAELASAITLIGGSAGDTLTGGAGADVIIGNAGDDAIVLTAGGADTVTGGLGQDTITVDVTNADTITDFAKGATGDVLKFGVTDINSVIGEISTGGGSALAAGAIAITEIAKGTPENMVAGTELIVITGGTYADNTALKNDITADGTTTTTDIEWQTTASNNDAFLLVYSDGTNAYLVAVEDANGGSNTSLAVADVTVTTLATLTGITSITAGEFDTANFVAIA